MIESITWYLKNTKETLPKFQENCIYIYIYIYIYNYSYEYISYILSLQFEIVTVGIRALAWVQEWKTKKRGFNKFLTCTRMVRTRKGTMIGEGFEERQ